MALTAIINEVTFSVGDLVRVHQTISDKEKDKFQVFEGRVLSIKGRGENKTFIVRKIAINKIGVEKIFPLNLPSITRIEVIKGMKTRRAKLFFLREPKGRLTKKQM